MYACKSIHKERLLALRGAEWADARREAQIMWHLSGGCPRAEMRGAEGFDAAAGSASQGTDKARPRRRRRRGRSPPPPRSIRSLHSRGPRTPRAPAPPSTAAHSLFDQTPRPGHPNLVRLHDAYEDNNYVHLVMELCTGGELVDKIVAKVRWRP